jgi:hypothetical protein
MLPALHSGFRGRPRELKKGERVHRSAIQRWVDCPDYRPPTLKNAHLDDGTARAFLATAQDEWIVS